MKKLKMFIKSNQAKTFYWQTGTNAVILLGVFFSELDSEKYPFVLFAIPLINALTKTMNKKYQERKNYIKYIKNGNY